MENEKSMNTEKQEPVIQTVETVNAAGAMRLEFADGLHIVPGWAVATLGGSEALEVAAGELSEVNYEDFMRQISEARSAAFLNSFQNRFVGNFLNRL